MRELSADVSAEENRNVKMKTVSSWCRIALKNRLGSGKDSFGNKFRAKVVLKFNFSSSFFFKNGPNPASFGLFSFFSHDKYSTNILNEKSLDGVLGTQTRGSRMVGVDKSTEL